MEWQFSDHIKSLLIRHGVDCEREPKVKEGLSRADFRMSRELIECKSDVSNMEMNKALGPCWIDKVIVGEAGGGSGFTGEWERTAIRPRSWD